VTLDLDFEPFNLLNNGDDNGTPTLTNQLAFHLHTCFFINNTMKTKTPFKKRSLNDNYLKEFH
jgi:hypothetical protein